MVVTALLAATALAFAYTEKLKLTPSPILGTRVDKIFSPVCACGTDTATISFRLRRRDRLTVELIDSRGRRVRTLVADTPARRGRVSFFWDGRSEAGVVVAEGVYRPRVHLAAERRTIVLPNPIRVDVTPPVVELVSLAPRVFSPDGDGVRVRGVVTARISGSPVAMSDFTTSATFRYLVNVLYVRDATGGVRIETEQTPHVRVGQIVEKGQLAPPAPGAADAGPDLDLGVPAGAIPGQPHHRVRAGGQRRRYL